MTKISLFDLACCIFATIDDVCKFVLIGDTIAQYKRKYRYN